MYIWYLAVPGVLPPPLNRITDGAGILAILGVMACLMLLPAEAEAAPSLLPDPYSGQRGDTFTAEISGHRTNHEVRIYSSIDRDSGITCNNPTLIYSGITDEYGDLSALVDVTLSNFPNGGDTYKICTKQGGTWQASYTFKFVPGVTLSTHHAAIGQEITVTVRDIAHRHLGTTAFCFFNENVGNPKWWCIEEGYRRPGTPLDSYTSITPIGRNEGNEEVRYTIVLPWTGYSSTLNTLIYGNNSAILFDGWNYVGNLGHIFGRVNATITSEITRHGEVVLRAENLVEGERTTAYRLSASSQPRSCEALINDANAVRIGRGHEVSDGEAIINIRVNGDTFGKAVNYVCIQDALGRQTPVHPLPLPTITLSESFGDLDGAFTASMDNFAGNTEVILYADNPPYHATDCTRIIEYGREIGSGRVGADGTLSVNVDTWENGFYEGTYYVCAASLYTGTPSPAIYRLPVPVTVISQPASGDTYGLGEVMRFSVEAFGVTGMGVDSAVLQVGVGGRIADAQLTSFTPTSLRFTLPVIGVDLIDENGIAIQGGVVNVRGSDGEAYGIPVLARFYPNHKVDGMQGAPPECFVNPTPSGCLTPWPPSISPPDPPPDDPWVLPGDGSRGLPLIPPGSTAPDPVYLPEDWFDYFLMCYPGDLDLPWDYTDPLPENPYNPPPEYFVEPPENPYNPVEPPAEPPVEPPPEVTPPVEPPKEEPPREEPPEYEPPVEPPKEEPPVGIPVEPPRGK